MNKKLSIAICSVCSLAIVGGSAAVAATVTNSIHDNSLNVLANELSELHFNPPRPDAPSAPEQPEPAIEDTECPDVAIMLEKTSYFDTDVINVTVEATDNIGVSSEILYLNDEEVVLSNGTCVLQNLSAGDYTLTVKAYDDAGNEGVHEVRFNVEAYVEPTTEEIIPDEIKDANLEWLIFDEEQGRWYYLVEEGDFLYKIQDRINVSVETMAKFNDINNPNLIYSGNKIYVTDVVDANADKNEAGISFMDGHTKDEITVDGE